MPRGRALLPRHPLGTAGRPASLTGSDVDKPPPAPAGWNKTIADLYAELKAGRRSVLGSPEIEWAREYERSLLPADVRYPRTGDIYEAVEDLDVDYITAWSAPMTDGGRGRVLRGERIIVRYALDRATMVYASPINYEAVEDRILPESVKASKGFDGFYWALRTKDLNSRFRLITTPGAA
jgi:hypothetical protein